MWRLVKFTGMSKREVLEDIYPDELEFILAEMRTEELKRYQGYYNQLAAGMIGHTKKNDNTLEKYIDSVVNQIKELTSQDAPPESEVEPDDAEVIRKKLQGFVGQIGRGREVNNV